MRRGRQPPTGEAFFFFYRPLDAEEELGLPLLSSEEADCLETSMLALRASIRSPTLLLGCVVTVVSGSAEPNFTSMTRSMATLYSSWRL